MTATKSVQKVARKTRRPDRKVGWDHRIDHATGVIRITQDGATSHYFISPMAADQGEAYLIEKADDTTGKVCERYTVSVSEEGARCTCKGFSRWSHCKHAAGLQALAAAGRM